ncbi:MAG: hypothetical protein MUC36_13000 [Planctomycetes bacterium]|jgi:hypothetical protein|nr:hypothetical protein [Planctomycetota bacterium]
MNRLYVYNNLHAGDLLFSRPLYRAVIDSGRFELVLAAHRNNSYLLADLVGPGVRLHTSDYLEQGPIVLYDLRADCPPDCVPISSWLGEYRDTGSHQWHNVVTVFERQLRQAGIDYRVPQVPGQVPMVDFTPRPLSIRVTRPSVYVDNSQPRTNHAKFDFDLRAMAQRHPDVQFLCTRRPDSDLGNVIDASHLDLRDLSAVSDQCLAILGKGSGPFCCTYTEANRRKPRGLCGYQWTWQPSFWDYPGNPLRQLATMADVLVFLDEALAADSRPRALAPCS